MMKNIRINMLMVILFSGNFAYSLEAKNSDDNTLDSFVSNGTDNACGTQSKALNKENDSVPLKPLFELFTSSTCGPCVEAHEVLDELFENNPNEYASIKYQMNWPGSGDPYYTEEGGVRRDYYNVNSIPVFLSMLNSFSQPPA
jgi:thiol-disulfide isomerase/thioredoxin